MFANKGVNGRWTGALTAEDAECYRSTAVAELGDDCAPWLEPGEI